MKLKIIEIKKTINFRSIQPIVDVLNKIRPNLPQKSALPNADGKVTGVKEALDKLKSSEPTFFKDVEKESNPLNEGFSPVDKQSNSNLNSFSQAFRLMEE